MDRGLPARGIADQDDRIDLLEADDFDVFGCLAADVKDPQADAVAGPTIAQFGQIVFPAGTAQVGNDRHFADRIGARLRAVH